MDFKVKTREEGTVPTWGLKKGVRNKRETPIYLLILNFHSRLRGLRGFVLSAAARALTTEAPILDPVFLSFFLALWAPISPKNLDKSRKKRYQGSMSRADANGSKKTCDFGLLKTSQTKPASRREHDFRVLALCRKSCIWELFWTFIFERL